MKAFKIIMESTDYYGAIVWAKDAKEAMKGAERLQLEDFNLSGYGEVGSMQADEISPEEFSTLPEYKYDGVECEAFNSEENEDEDE